MNKLAGIFNFSDAIKMESLNQRLTRQHVLTRTSPIPKLLVIEHLVLISRNNCKLLLTAVTLFL